MAIDYRLSAIGFTMPMIGCDEPYGMTTSVMVSLHINPATFADNVVNTYSPVLASWSVIGNHVETIQPHMGIGFGS